MRRFMIMRRLGRFVGVGVKEHERGAAAAIVAVLFGGGVMMGMAALSIDVGQLMWERRQLQNGADAAALSLARSCIESPSACNTTVTATANGLKQVNNSNNYQDSLGGFDPSQYAQAGGVAGVCGRAVPTGGSLPTCVPPSGALVDCTPLPSILTSYPTIPYVEVHTQTKSSSGDLLPPWVAQMMLGSNYKGESVKACARAAWGPAAPTNLTVFPILMSLCDWEGQTGYNGTPGSATYPNGPDDSITPYGYGTGNPWPTVERTVYTKNNPTTCPTWNGNSAPGGFYSIASSGCSTNVVSNGWVQGTTGNASPCSTMQTNSGVTLAGKVVYIPIFDCMTTGPTTITSSTNCNSGTGNNTYYHVAGYAAFYVTGWYFSNTTQASIRTGQVPCSNGDRCISGWFLKDLIPAGQINPPPSTPVGPSDFGLYVVQPVG